MFSCPRSVRTAPPGLPTWLLGLLAVLTACAPAWGQITFSQDFDSGSLDVAETHLDGSTVHLAPRATFRDYHQWTYFQASGVSGQTLTFVEPTVRQYWPYSADHRFAYSYDQVNWSYFDGGAVGAGTYSFWNDSPFTGDDVYVAYALPYPVSRTAELVARVQSSPWVAPTVSADASLVIGQSVAWHDEMGRAVPAMDIHAFRITDPAAAGLKQKVVLAAGNHSGETTGNYALEGMVEFLLSDSPAAAALRRNAEFYVYPQLDPAGRWAGFFRSTPRVASGDHNRAWEFPVLHEEIRLLEQAMRADTGGAADWFFDFHGMYAALGSVGVYDHSSGDSSEFLAAFAGYEPEAWIQPGSVNGALAASWAGSETGLGAALTFSPETGTLPVPEERYLEIGQHYALALHDAGVPEPASATLLLLGWAALVARRRR